MKDWERHPVPTERDVARRKRIEKAIAHVEQVAQAIDVNPNLGTSIAVLLLEILRKVDRVSHDAEYAMQGVRALLKAEEEHSTHVRDFLNPPHGVHRRGDDPPAPRYERPAPKRRR